MNKHVKYSLLFMIFMMAALAYPGYAHQQKESLTSILFNARTGHIEVAHRFYIHDAEHAVKHIAGKNADLLTDPDTQEAFARYMSEQFSATADGELLLLKLLGHEVEGKFFWVYQETSFTDHPTKMEVSYKEQMEIWPSKRNIVNIEGIGSIKSVELVPSNRTQAVRFD